MYEVKTVVSGEYTGESKKFDTYNDAVGYAYGIELQWKNEECGAVLFENGVRIGSFFYKEMWD